MTSLKLFVSQTQASYAAAMSCLVECMQAAIPHFCTFPDQEAMCIAENDHNIIQALPLQESSAEAARYACTKLPPAPALPAAGTVHQPCMHSPSACLT